MIRGEFLNLRAIDRYDDETLYLWFNDPRVMRGWAEPDPIVSRSEVQRRIEGWLAEEAELGRPTAVMAVDLNGEPVGLAILSLASWQDRSVELSFLIGEPDRWNEGLGSDLVTVVVDTCFSTWNFERVVARSEAFNERAHRLLRRCGFVEEARLREARFMEGAYHDILVFGCLRRERPGPAMPRLEEGSDPAAT